MDYSELDKKFDEFYVSIEPELKKLENERLKKVKKFQIPMIMIFALYILLLFIIHFLHVYKPEYDSMIKFCMIVLVIVGILYVGYLYYICFGNLALYVKQNFLPSILKIFGDFQSSDTEKITVDEMKQYPVFNSTTEIENDDIIKGTYNGLKILLQESKLKHISHYKNQKSQYYIFTGLIVKTEFPKKNTGTTLIFPTVWAAFSTVHISSGVSDLDERYKRVQLEDVEFAKIYNVFSTDQVEARYILTTGFMERLKNIRDLYTNKFFEMFPDFKSGGQISTPDEMQKKPMVSFLFIFDKNNIYILINTAVNFFEVFNPFKTMLDKNRYKAVFFQMTTIMDIIDGLKLDMKIGL